MREHPLAFNEQGPRGEEAQHRVIANPALKHALHEMFCFPLNEPHMLSGSRGTFSSKKSGIITKVSTRVSGWSLVRAEHGGSLLTQRRKARLGVPRTRVGKAENAWVWQARELPC